MFTHVNPNYARITHAVVCDQVITSNANQFVPAGTNHICLKDYPAVEEHEDNGVLIPELSAYPDYTEAIFFAKTAIGPGYNAAVEAYLETKIPELRARGVNI